MGNKTINRRPSDTPNRYDTKCQSPDVTSGLLKLENGNVGDAFPKVFSSNNFKELKESKWDYFRQMCCVLVISLNMNIIGTSVGWSAIVPKIQADNSTEFNLTNTDVRWLVSSIFLASIPGNLFGGSIGELLGPRRFLLILLPLTIGCWLMQAFTNTKALLHTGRIILGVIYGLTNTLVQPLVTEISEPSIRGIANILPEVMATASMLYSYVLAHFLPWRIGTALCGALIIPSFFLTLFIPESPYWLVRHGKSSEAEIALGRLLGRSRLHKRAIMIREIQTSVQNQSQGSLAAQIRLFKRPQNWKPVLLVSILIILRETSGRINIFMYTVYIFRDAGVQVDPFLCTIIVGITRLINTIFAALLVEKTGRKKLLLISVLMCGTVIITAGACLLVKTEFAGDKWIPLICILIYVVSYSTGVGPITWALMGELLPSPIRSLSTSVVCIFFSTAIFVSNNIFLQLKDILGLGISFIMFGCVSYIMAITIGCFLPETKGKTLLELEKIFGAKQKRNSNRNIPNISCQSENL